MSLIYPPRQQQMLVAWRGGVGADRPGWHHRKGWHQHEKTEENKSEILRNRSNFSFKNLNKIGEIDLFLVKTRKGHPEICRWSIRILPSHRTGWHQP